jgi:hypothetical protein
VFGVSIGRAEFSAAKTRQANLAFSLIAVTRDVHSDGPKAQRRFGIAAIQLRRWKSIALHG